MIPTQSHYDAASWIYRSARGLDDQERSALWELIRAYFSGSDLPHAEAHIALDVIWRSYGSVLPPPRAAQAPKFPEIAIGQRRATAR